MKETILLTRAVCFAILVFCLNFTSAHELITRTVSGREYLAYLPEDYATRTEPMQVLLALHPATFNAQSFQDVSHLEAEPAAADVIVLYPNGSTGALGQSWDGASPQNQDRGETSKPVVTESAIHASGTTCVSPHLPLFPASSPNRVLEEKDALIRQLQKELEKSKEIQRSAQVLLAVENYWLS